MPLFVFLENWNLFGICCLALTDGSALEFKALSPPPSGQITLFVDRAGNEKAEFGRAYLEDFLGPKSLSSSSWVFGFSFLALE